jgi:hypothetical protein
MTNIKKRIYCISIYNELFNKINSLNCIPVGLGKNIYSSGWLRDNTGTNISSKNSNYGELTFWFWLWKNELKNIPDNTWIGFSQYRRHWYKNKNKEYYDTNIYENVLKEVPKEWNNYDTILAEKITTKKVKFMKLLKYGKKALIKNPKAIISNYRNIKFNFDMMHGTGILDEAINLLDEDNKKKFREYCKNETSFSPVNMFICKSKSKIISFYQCLFDWLEKCEHKFGLELDGYRNIRRYAFLAERFMPYWFNRNTKVLEWPIIFHDLREEKNNKDNRFI